MLYHRHHAHAVWCLSCKNSLERFVIVAKIKQHFNISTFLILADIELHIQVCLENLTANFELCKRIQ